MKLLFTALALALCLPSMGIAGTTTKGKTTPTTRKPASTHACEAKGREIALKVLKLHSDNDDRASIGDMTLRSPIQSPNGDGKRYDVLEYQGLIYKGEYRIRTIFAQMEGCVSMGFEILDLSRL